MSSFNLSELFESVVDVVPDREALVTPARRLTYAELDERANRLAHHLAAHEGGWQVRGNANEALVYYDPDGRPVDPGSTPTSSSPDAVPLFNTAAGIDIDPQTVESTWAGERCDYDTIIIDLLARERRAAEADIDLVDAA